MSAKLHLNLITDNSNYMMTYQPMMWFTLTCLCLVVGVQAQSESLVVDLVDQGTLRGFRHADGGLFTFLDVPYATAPQGTDKFKAPLPAPTWTDTFDAYYRGIVCTQAGITTEELIMQEDCLVANIFVPETNTTNLPVLVVVHGGAYKSGVGTFFRYNNLVQTQNVVVVTFNYRLGVHGFLCLGTKEAPGNAAMKDQVALLRWVNKNIARFGGNPADITINGCSAGGGSVDLLTLSPTTTGLFSKIITESGSSLSFLGAQMDPIANSKAYARALNFSNYDNFEALVNFYINAPNDLLYSRPDAMIVNTEILFTPCIERDLGEEMFLSESPWSILTNGKYPKLPLLNGYVQNEGTLQLAWDNFYFIDSMNDNFSHFLPFDLQFESEEQKLEVAKKVKEFYFGKGNITRQNILEFVDYYTDVMFTYSMLKGLKLRREANADTVYLYEYTFTDENTPTIQGTEVRAVMHCAQDIAVMDEDTTNATEAYVQMKAFMRELWLNFIISGKPVPEGSSLPQWPHVNSTRSPHMSLHRANDSSIYKDLFMEKRAELWDDIYDKHYLEPKAPSGATSVLHSITMIVGVLLMKIILFA